MNSFSSHLVVLVLTLLAACASERRPGFDGGPGTDSGLRFDGGPRPDGSPPTDGGSTECAGAADGVACTTPGVSCGGPCTDPCSFCNILRCEDGVWGRLEVFPAPCFPCGDSVQCVAGETYCDATHSDVGEPTAYECRDLPAACTAMPTCACLETAAVVFDECTEGEKSGAVTVEHFGG